MNKDQLKGNLKDAVGKVQEATGKLLGNTVQRAKGVKKQVDGHVQRAVGDIKEVVKDASKK